MSKMLLLVLPLVVCAFIASACGGSSSDDSGAGAVGGSGAATSGGSGGHSAGGSAAGAEVGGCSGICPDVIRQCQPGEAPVETCCGLSCFSPK